MQPAAEAAAAAAAALAAAKALSDPGTSSLERWQKLGGARRARSGLTQVGSSPEALQGGLGPAAAWPSASGSAQPPAAGTCETDMLDGPGAAEAGAQQQQVPQAPGHPGQTPSSRERVVPEPEVPLPLAADAGGGALWAAPDACSCSDEEDQCYPSGPAMRAAKRRKMLCMQQQQQQPRHGQPAQREPGTAAPAPVTVARPGLSPPGQHKQQPQQATSKGGSAVSLGASGEGGSSSLAVSRQRKRVRYVQPVSAALEADLETGRASADASGSTGQGGGVALQPQQHAQQGAQDAERQQQPGGQDGSRRATSSGRAGGMGGDQGGTATGPTSLGVGGSRRASGNGSGSGEGSNEQPQAGQATEAGGGIFTTAGGGGGKVSGQQGSGGNSSGTDRRPHGNTNSQADSLYKPGPTSAAQQAAAAEQQYFAACQRQEAAEHYYYAAQRQKQDASNQLAALAAAASAAASAAEAAAAAASAGGPAPAAAAPDENASPKGTPSMGKATGVPGTVPSPAAAVMPPPAAAKRAAAEGAPTAPPSEPLQHKQPGNFTGRNPGATGPAAAAAARAKAAPLPLPPRQHGPARASSLAPGLGAGAQAMGPCFAQVPPWLPAAPPQYGQPPWHHPNPAEDASHKLGHMHQFYAQARDAFLGQVMEIMHSVQVMGQHQVQACAVQGADAQAIVRACNKAMEIVQSFSASEAPAPLGGPARGAAAPAAVPSNPSRLPGMSSEHPSSLFPASLCGPSSGLPTAFANVSGRFEGVSGAGMAIGTLPSAGGSIGPASRAGSLLPPPAPAAHAAARLATAGSGLLLASSGLAAPAGAAAVPGPRLPINPAQDAGPPPHGAGAAAPPVRSMGPGIAPAGPVVPKSRSSGATFQVARGFSKQGVATDVASQKCPTPAATMAAANPALPAADLGTAGQRSRRPAPAAAQGWPPELSGLAPAFGLVPPMAPLMHQAQGQLNPPLVPSPEAAAAAATAAAFGLATSGCRGCDTPAAAPAAAGVAAGLAGFSRLGQARDPPGLAAPLPPGELAMVPDAATIALALSLQAQQAQQHAPPQLSALRAALPMGPHAPLSTAGIAPPLPAPGVLAAAAAGHMGAGALWPSQLTNQWQ
ncbi:hypothetical protein N2152v2_003437 [Parachlorella kessleri]